MDRVLLVKLDTVDSTNLEVRRRAIEGAKEGLLVLSNHQTAGRGRLGRSWDTETDSIAMSLLLRPRIAADKVSMITIIAALAARKAIRLITGLDTDIKWPNDIKHENRKLAGILSESVFCGKEFYSVLGVGINVNNESFPEELKEIASSLRIETGEHFEREKIVEAFCGSFFEYYDRLCEDGDLRNMTEEYNSLCITEGGINEFGELRMSDGSLKRSGEV